MSELEARVVTADEVDAAALDRFLRRFFPETDCDFLVRHGEWWHRGPQHRFVATVGDTIAGYSALIPAPCRLDGNTHRAHWLVNIIVDPRFRRRGLQALLDRRIREDASLLLGFPNALAAKIHRKHGWGVSEKHRILLLPFDPARLRPVLRATGTRGVVMRAAARLARPFGSLLRARAARYRPTSARRLETPSSGDLGKIFERHQDPAVTTTLRNSEHLRWRYLEAPYSDELEFFAAGDPSPRAAAITRSRLKDRGLTVKILDLFGDLEDSALVADLLRLVARRAARARAVELTAFATLPQLYPIFRSAGFVLHTLGRSCWLSADPSLMRLLTQRPSHWTFGDSDQEEPA